MTDQTAGCRTTRHCARHDFCHRCAPDLAEASTYLVKGMSAARIDDERKGAVYAQLAATVRDAARTAAARQTTGQDDTEQPGCGHCGGPHPWNDCAEYADLMRRTGGQAPAPAVGQPAEAHDTEPRQPAYDAVYAYIRGLGDHLPPYPVERNAMIWRAVNAALDTYRAAVLREAAELGRELSRQGYSAQEIANRLDRMAEEARS